MNVIDNDPVLDLCADPVDPGYDGMFAEIQSGAKTKSTKHRVEIPTFRASFARSDTESTEDFEDAIEAEPEQKPQVDLRHLITKMKLSQSLDTTDTRSDDSFYSIEQPVPKYSLSYIRDMINAVGNPNATLHKKQEVMATLSKIELR